VHAFPKYDLIVLSRETARDYVFVVPEPDSPRHLFEELEGASIHAYRADEEIVAGEVLFFVVTHGFRRPSRSLPRARDGPVPPPFRHLERCASKLCQRDSTIPRGPHRGGRRRSASPGASARSERSDVHVSTYESIPADDVEGD